MGCDLNKVKVRSCSGDALHSCSGDALHLQISETVGLKYSVKNTVLPTEADIVLLKYHPGDFGGNVHRGTR